MKRRWRCRLGWHDWTWDGEPAFFASWVIEQGVKCKHCEKTSTYTEQGNW